MTGECEVMTGPAAAAVVCCRFVRSRFGKVCCHGHRVYHVFVVVIKLALQTGANTLG